MGFPPPPSFAVLYTPAMADLYLWMCIMGQKGHAYATFDTRIYYH